MASVFGIQGGRPRQDKVEARKRSVRRRARGSTIPAIRAVTAGGYTRAVETDDGRTGGVPGRVGSGDSGDRSGRELGDIGDGHGGRQEFVVHVAGILFAGRRDDRGGAVGFVAKRFARAMYEERDRVVRLAEPGEQRNSDGGVCDVGIGGDEGIPRVRQSVIGMAGIG